MKYERPILAIHHRKGRALEARHYARLETAIRRMTELAVLEGEPRDVVEISHKHTGLQIGTIKVGVNSLKTTWIWDKKNG